MNERFVTVKTILFSQICVHLLETQIKTEFPQKSFWSQENFYHGIRTSLGWLCSLWDTLGGFSYRRQVWHVNLSRLVILMENSNKVFTLDIKTASKVLIVIYWIMKERIFSLTYGSIVVKKALKRHWISKKAWIHLLLVCQCLFLYFLHWH